MNEMIFISDWHSAQIKGSSFHWGRDGRCFLCVICLWLTKRYKYIYTIITNEYITKDSKDATPLYYLSDLNIKRPMDFHQMKYIIQPQIDKMEHQLPNEIVGHTKQLIRILLPDGKCNIENITSLLSTSERSLQRKLKASGTSFRQIVEGVRKTTAKQHILHSDLSNSQLAYLLGYSELSVFTRAFKHWFGVSPSQWKKTFQS